jgi:hypothetical protein
MKSEDANNDTDSLTGCLKVQKLMLQKLMGTCHTVSDRL